MRITMISRMRPSVNMLFSGWLYSLGTSRAVRSCRRKHAFACRTASDGLVGAVGRVEVVVEEEVGERHRDGDLQAPDVMPPAHGKEEQVAGTDLHLRHGRAAECREAAVIDALYVHLREAMAVVVQEGQGIRRHHAHPLSTPHLGHEVVCEVGVQRRDRSLWPEPQETAGSGSLVPQ